MYIYTDVIKNIKKGWIPFFTKTKNELIDIFDILNKCSKIIYPYSENIFKTFFYTNPENIKLVILGQDPYANEQNNIPDATGLAFSVPVGHKIPASLKNIYKEIISSYPESQMPKHGCLDRWAKEEKILLLNTSLTVEKGKSNSHTKVWKLWINKLIKYINDINPETIFLLMGKNAESKIEYIDNNKHKIFITSHPSPYSARKGFLNSNIFYKINDYLKKKYIQPIKWL